MRAAGLRTVADMNTKRLLVICFSALVLVIATGGSAAAGNGPALCDGAECGPQPPPPPPPPGPPPPPPQPSYLPIGWFDTVDGEGTAYGWTCDPNDFGAALEVHFYADGPAGGGGVFIGKTSANTAREAAVGGNCGGNSSHGFVFPLPVSVRDGGSHSLYAYAINIGPDASNPLLSGSPKSYTAGPSDPWCFNVSCAYAESGVEDNGVYSYTGSGCRMPVVKKTYKSMTGYTHWIYYQRVTFCWRNGRITSFSRERWHWESENFFSGWSFEGHSNTNCVGDCRGRGVGLWTTTAWTQGRFGFCYFKITICTEVAPLIGIRVYGNGSWRPFYDYAQ
jgi:hypothetical protein